MASDCLATGSLPTILPTVFTPPIKTIHPGSPERGFPKHGDGRDDVRFMPVWLRDRIRYTCRKQLP